MLSTESDPPGSVLPIVRVEDDKVVFGQEMLQPRFEKVLLSEFPARIGAACAGKTAALAAKINAPKRRCVRFIATPESPADIRTQKLCQNETLYYIELFPGARRGL